MFCSIYTALSTLLYLHCSIYTALSTLLYMFCSIYTALSVLHYLLCFIYTALSVISVLLCQLCLCATLSGWSILDGHWILSLNTGYWVNTSVNTPWSIASIAQIQYRKCRKHIGYKIPLWTGIVSKLKKSKIFTEKPQHIVVTIQKTIWRTWRWWRVTAIAQYAGT